MLGRCWSLLGLVWLLLAGGLLVSRAAQAQPTETNRIHMMAKPAVVRIYAGYVGTFSSNRGQTRIPYVGSGSGLIINSAGYILTNAHVVADVKEGDDAARKQMYRLLVLQALEANSLPVTDENIQKAAAFLDRERYQLVDLRRINLVFLQSGKSLPFEIKAFGAPLGSGTDLATGKDVAVLKVETRNAPTLRLGVSGDVKVGDRVWVMGYPGAADSDNLDAQSELEPTTNDGAISAQKATRDGTPVLQTNANTTHGNSGGPVLNAQGEVIGLLTFRGNTVNNQEVQGFNFIVPIDTAKEFVRQAGTDNTLGTVDEKWKSGLEHYWKQEYSYAQRDFQEIVTLFPDHREAAKLITDSQEHIVKGEDQSGAEGAAIAGMALGAIVLAVGGGLMLVLLLIVVVIVVVVLLRRKKRAPLVGAPPAPAMAMAGAYGAPPAGPPPGYGGAPGPYPAAPPGAAGPTPPAAGLGAPAPYGAPPAAAPVRAAARGGGTQIGGAVRALRFVSGPTAGQLVPVLPGGAVIGREPGAAEIVVQDPQVSSAHAWVGLRGDALVFVDRGSTNGSLVNDRPVAPGQEIVLNSGDTVTLGRTSSVKLVVV